MSFKKIKIIKMKDRKCCTSYTDYYLEIDSNCLPNYTITEKYDKDKIVNFKIPIETKLDPSGFWGPYDLKEKFFLPLGPIGVSVNGVPFFSRERDNKDNPEVNYFYNQLPNNVSVYEAKSKFSNLNDLFCHQLENQTHSNIIGFSFDGFPIYGPIGWDSEKNVKLMTSSYQDSEYIDNSGDLDICNGIFCPTPDYPNGIYHYHATIKVNEDGKPKLEDGQVVSVYPHLIARYRGIPEVRSFIEPEE